MTHVATSLISVVCGPLKSHALGCLLGIAIFCAAFTTKVQAQLTYEFRQEGTADILATLELGPLPLFDPSDILRLEVFDPDTPDFSAVVAEGLFVLDIIDDDGANGLGRGAFDISPETSLFASEEWAFAGAERFIFEFSEAPFGDRVGVFRTAGVEGEMFIHGDWFVVPEPSAWPTISRATLLIISTGRRRRNAGKQPARNCRAEL